MGNKMALKPEQVSVMQGLRNGGMSYARIAGQLGLAQSTVISYLDPGYRERSRARVRKAMAEARAHQQDIREKARGIGYRIIHLGQGRSVSYPVPATPDPTQSLPRVAQVLLPPIKPEKPLWGLFPPAKAPLGIPCHIESVTGCKWVVDHDGRHLHCNQPRLGTGPYCAEHWGRAWQ